MRETGYEAVKVAEAARATDCTVGHKVLCYLQIFQLPEADRKPDVLNNCKSQLGTCPEKISYPGIPKPTPCTTVTNVPCMHEWLEKEYTSKIWYKLAPTAECTVCLNRQFIRRNTNGGLEDRVLDLRYGWRVTPQKLLPVYNHHGARLFDANKMVEYAEKNQLLIDQAHVDVKDITAESAEEWARKVGVGLEVSARQGLKYGPSIQASVGAEFQIETSETTSRSYAEKTSKVVLANLALPRPQIRGDELRGLLDDRTAGILNSVKTAEDAELIVDEFGPFYITSAEFGALLRLVTSASSREKVQSTELEASLTAGYDNAFQAVKGSINFKLGYNSASSSSKTGYFMTATGGDPTVLTSEGIQEWHKTAKDHLSIIGYTLGPLYDLIEDDESHRLIEAAVLKVTSECPADLCPRLTHVVGNLKWADDPRYCLTVADSNRRVQGLEIELYWCGEPIWHTQKWSVPKSDGENTLEKIQWAAAPQFCLEVFGGETTNFGSKFHTWPCRSSKDLYNINVKPGQTGQIIVETNHPHKCVGVETNSGGGIFSRRRDPNGWKIKTKRCFTGREVLWEIPQV